PRTAIIWYVVKSAKNYPRTMRSSPTMEPVPDVPSRWCSARQPRSSQRVSRENPPNRSSGALRERVAPHIVFGTQHAVAVLVCGSLRSHRCPYYVAQEGILWPTVYWAVVFMTINVYPNRAPLRGATTCCVIC